MTTPATPPVATPITPQLILDWSTPVAMWLIVIGFNLVILWQFKKIYGSASIKAALREKKPVIVAGQPVLGPVAPAPVLAAPEQAIAVAPPPAQQAAGTPPDDNTSYSRVTGMIGAVVLTCFIWGLANVLFVEAFDNPDKISAILTGVGPFILSGSALFAPYAFNQLSQVIKS